MLGRKPSASAIDALVPPGSATAGGVGPPGAFGAEYGPDETLHGEGGDVIWTSRNASRKILRTLTLLRYAIIHILFHVGYEIFINTV